MSLAPNQKKARDLNAELVFTDESGLLMAPLTRASLAPAAHTPVIRTRAKHRQKVSVIAALCRSGRTDRMRLVHETFIDQYVDDFSYAEFLDKHLLRRSRRPLILVHDGAPLHNGPWTTDLLEDAYPRLQAFRFPAYAPELNPVEQLWTWSKGAELANFVPAELGDLAAAVDHVVGVAEQSPQRLKTFFDAAELPW